jgi:hypothetical protein
MHASTIIAILAATAATATPLRARDTAAPSYVPAPSAADWSGSPSPSAPTGDAPSPPSAGAPTETSQLGVPNAAPNPATPSGLIAELITANNAVARFNTIKEDIANGEIKLVFDHNPSANPGVTPGMGGQVDLASRANFPVLTGLGISSASIFFQPCGLNTPHVHPRATEIFTLATNTEMTTGFVLENGLTEEFSTNLTFWQSTAFPQGSIHWQQNESCEPATGVAGLNSDDPGASSIAQNFLRFTNQDVVEASLGFPDQLHADNFAQFKDAIPAPLAKGIAQCFDRCGIKY